MNRTDKKVYVSALHDRVKDAAVVLVAHYKGLTVSEVSDLRNRLRHVGATFKVTPNRLTRLALQGTAYESLAGHLTGPTALTYAADPVAAAKILHTFSKENDKLVMVGGAMGAQALGIAQITTLAKLPSMDELRGNLVRLIQTPATRIAGVVQAPAGQIARVINAYSQKAA